MKRHLFGTVGSLAAVLLLLGCAKDPTATLRGGGVETVVISNTYVEMDVGDAVRLNAKAYDLQGNVLAELPVVTVDDATVTELTIDELTSGDPLPQTDFDLDGLADGSVVVSATAGGKTGTANIIVFPTQFNGTVALDATGAVDLLTVSATANVKFDADNSTVTVGDQPTVLLSRTAEEIQVAVISASPLTGADVAVTDLKFQPPYGSYDLDELKAPTGVDIRTTLFDGTISVDAAGQADEITINSSANFEFAADAAVLVGGKPTFVVARSTTQLVVAGGNISAVTAGSVTIQNALFLGEFDVASVVAQSTVNLEAFDNSFTGSSLGSATDITAGPFPLVYYALVSGGAPDQLTQFNSGADLDVTVTALWLTEADVDIYWINPGGSIYACGGGCGSSNPEVSNHTVPGGTQDFLDMALYDGDDSIVRVTVEAP
jgi:hypothetical protein